MAFHFSLVAPGQLESLMGSFWHFSWRRFEGTEREQGPQDGSLDNGPPMPGPQPRFGSIADRFSYVCSLGFSLSCPAEELEPHSE